MDIKITSGDKEVVLQDIHTKKRLICFPVDFSAHSDTTYNWALKTLLNVQTDYLYFITVKPNNIKEPVEQYRELLLKFGNDAKAKGFEVSAIILHGDPRNELCREFDLIKPAIVVVGTKGSGASKDVVGSVAQHMGQHSHWPVLIAHPHPHLPSLAE